MNPSAGRVQLENLPVIGPIMDPRNLKIPSHEVSCWRASKCRRPHAMTGSTAPPANWRIALSLRFSSPASASAASCSRSRH